MIQIQPGQAGCAFKHKKLIVKLLTVSHDVFWETKTMVNQAREENR